MHHIAVNGPVLWANLWGFGCGLLVGGFAGYGLAVRNHTRRNYAPPGNHTVESGSPQRERELFTLSGLYYDPKAVRPGNVVNDSGRKHIITRVLDLGSFQDIDGQRHQQWRVYGRPA